jgi:hypothetical protein
MRTHTRTQCPVCLPVVHGRCALRARGGRTFCARACVGARLRGRGRGRVVVLARARAQASACSPMISTVGDPSNPTLSSDASGRATRYSRTPVPFCAGAVDLFLDASAFHCQSQSSRAVLARQARCR